MLLLIFQSLDELVRGLGVFGSLPPLLPAALALFLLSCNLVMCIILRIAT